jgi:uncharacterized membrane protein YgdD (TMEM256/DUF423 family)
MHKKILLWAAILGALAVAIGAFGTHNLKPKLAPQYFEAFQTGVQYHFYHAIALLVTGLIYRVYRHNYISSAAFCFAFGIIFFSFTLYVYALTSLTTNGAQKVFARLTPVGGVFFIIGWILIAMYFSKNRPKTQKPKSSDE